MVNTPDYACHTPHELLALDTNLSQLQTINDIVLISRHSFVYHK